MKRASSIPLALCAALAAAAPPTLASTVTLLASGTHAFSQNSANTVFSLTDIQPAGSGVFNPIVRIENKDSEQGYNTQDPASTLDGHPNGPANPLVPFNSAVDTNGNVLLALDYNEAGENKGPVYLEDLQLVVSTNAARVGPVAIDPFTPQPIVPVAGEAELYRMFNTTRTDAGHVGEGFNIFLDADDNLAAGNGGSGQADLLVNIHLNFASLATYLDGNHYLYVYSRFSTVDAGYEEWRLFTNEPGIPTGGGPRPVPLPPAAWAGLSMLGGLGLLKLRKRF